MRRAAAVLAAAALLLAGCGEDADQHAARVAVERAVPDAGRVHCTRNARIGYVNAIRTSLYVCLVRRSGDSCDAYDALRRQGGGFTVRLHRRGVDCVLPAG